LNDKKRFALAARIQKRIQENDPNFWLIKRRNEIKKKIERKNDSRSTWDFNEKEQKEAQR